MSTIAPSSLNVIIVEKTGQLKELKIKEYNEAELYKKCGFKKADDFVKHTTWDSKFDGKKYKVSLYGKADGKANSENKYDFPPPVDNLLLFGNCVLVGDSDLSIDVWNKIYVKLFGGFEDLVDEPMSEDEEVVKKTKHGYEKDGFVVDSSSEEDDNSEYYSDGSEEQSSSGSDVDVVEQDLNLSEIGSELQEEEYDYSDDL
jgi:hypothetical protein